MSFKNPHHKAETTFITESEGKFTIKPRGLNIVWGNDSRYWKISDEIAELIQVSWLEVSGLVYIKKSKKYKVKFEVNFKDPNFGWDGTDVLVMAKVGKTGRYKYKVSHLTSTVKNILPLEIEVDEGKELHFGLYEVWSGKWKGGLEIIEAVISPVDN